LLGRTSLPNDLPFMDSLIPSSTMYGVQWRNAKRLPWQAITFVWFQLLFAGPASRTRLAFRLGLAPCLHFSGVRTTCSSI
jgi:hypothetical protein